jgi:acyl-coenzyme A synthetase/AMP-(fatty) acid ligase
VHRRFAALGIRRGDRIGLLLPNCPQFFIVELGAWKLGAIAAPMSPIHTEHELEGPIREHGIETLVTLRASTSASSRVQPRTGLRRVIATNIKDHFPRSFALFTLFRETREGDRITLQQGDYDLARLLREHCGRRPQRAAIRPRIRRSC